MAGTSALAQLEAGSLSVHSLLSGTLWPVAEDNKNKLSIDADLIIENDRNDLQP